jgi:predicted nucleic acid-binding Zn ribbon protein
MGWEPLPGRAEPVSLDTSLTSLQRLLGTARPDALMTVRSQWASIVGARLAAHCRLDALHHGTLVVATHEPAVAEQLRWASADLVAAVNAVMGSEELREVEVRVVRAATPTRP